VKNRPERAAEQVADTMDDKLTKGVKMDKNKKDSLIQRLKKEFESIAFREVSGILEKRCFSLFFTFESCIDRFAVNSA